MAAKKQAVKERTDKHPFLLTVEECARQLNTSIENGLTAQKVQELQRECPPNELDDGGGIAWHKILIKQLTNAMILVSSFFMSLRYKTNDSQVLVFAMALSYGIGDYIEGGVLTAVIVLNVSIGFFQELSAEKKMESLRMLSSPSASVLRDGKVDVISRYFSNSTQISNTTNTIQF